MKTILSVAIAATAFAGSAFAQECPYSKSKATSQAATCQDAKSECASTCSETNTVVAAFKKLDAKAQKEVATAITSMSKLCPMGKRMPQTVASLDRLYTASIAQLSGMAKNEKAPEAFRKDVAAQLAMVTELSKLNKSTLSTMQALMATSNCCEGEKECESSCADKTAEKSSCCNDAKDAKKGCAITEAESVCSSWKTAGAELAKFSKCEKSQAAMKQHMAVLAKHKIDVMPLVAGNFSKQVAMLKKGAASLACPKGGLMARNSEVMSACSASKSACESTVKYMMAANKLLASVPAMGAPSNCATECNGEKSECSSAKSECSGAKSECSSAKSECSSSKSECSKSKCPAVKQ